MIIRPPKPKKIDDAFTVRALKDKCLTREGWCYRLEWYIDGKMRTKALGRHPEPAEAVAKAIEALGTGDVPARDLAGRDRTAPRTMDQLFRLAKAASETDPSLKPTTRRAYAAAYAHLEGFFGPIPVKRLRFADLEEYRGLRLRESAAPATLRLEFSVLSRTWRWGRRRGMTPMVDLPTPAMPSPQERPRVVPSPAEIQQVLAWTRAEVDAGRCREWVYVALVLFWATGARCDELAALDWSALDLSAGTIRLTGQHGGKTGARILSVKAAPSEHTPEWWAAVRAWRAAQSPPSEHVLSVSYATVRVQLNGRHLPAACAALGIAPFTLHAIRHAAVTAFLEASPTPADIRAQFGHSFKVANAIYAHPTAGRQATLARKAGLGRLTAPQAP